MSDYSRSAPGGSGSDELLRWEELGPVDRAVRRALFQARILSSPDIAVDDWVHHWEDDGGRFGFMIGVTTAPPSESSGPPFDALLTLACEAQGTRAEQEGRLLSILLCMREVLLDTGNFEFVLAASDRLHHRAEPETPRFRRAYLGFNVTGELLEAERDWQAG